MSIAMAMAMAKEGVMDDGNYTSGMMISVYGIGV